MITHNLPISKDKLKLFQNETKKYVELNKIIYYATNGWPNKEK